MLCLGSANRYLIVYLSSGQVLSSQLVIDAMANFSPIVKQIRSGKKPDGVCLLVGSCARGFKENPKSDVIFSSSSVRTVGNSAVQYFWEAFPAGSGPTDRTTYMFIYIDPEQGCPKLEDLLEDYWTLMPEYQASLCSLTIPSVTNGRFASHSTSALATSKGVSPNPLEKIDGLDPQCEDFLGNKNISIQDAHQFFVFLYPLAIHH
ncbi:uncharacterized protein LOC144712846 isoform X4 [Wolffia australiana]